VILAGIIAATLVWPHQRGAAEQEQRQELLGRLATDMRQAASGDRSR
jgi:hypothetical protein